AARDVDRCEVELDVGERLAHGVGGDGVGVDAQPHGRGAALQVVEHRAAGGGDVGVLVQLGDLPAVLGVAGADRGAAGEGGDAGVAQFRGGVVGRVQRLDLDAVHGVAREALVGLFDAELATLRAPTVEDLEDLTFPV